MERIFEYLEVVKIRRTESTSMAALSEKVGTILGYNFVENIWVYSIDIEELDEIVFVEEEFLISTGRFNEESNIYPGSAQ